MKKIYLLALAALISVGSFAQDIVITEISYNPPESGSDTTEYIELYNNGAGVVDLSGWQFTSGVVYTFPTGVTLNAGEYLVIAVDSIAVQNRFGITGVLQWTVGGLSNGGEPIALKDGGGVLQDSLRYDDVAPWPGVGSAQGGADGGGATIVFCDPNLDNTDGANWSVTDVSSTTGMTINGKEVWGHPGAGCPVVSDPIVEFGATSVSVDENVGAVMVTLNIQQENASATSVDVTVGVASTATAVNDYTFTSPTTVTFPANDNTPQTFMIPIIDDTDAEPAETIVLELGNFTNNAVVGANTTYTITINASDVPAPTTDIVITEIMYNPPETGTDSLEFLELYNNGSSAIDVTGWTVPGVAFTFPALTMNPGDVVVIAEDSSALANTLGYTGALNWGGSLSNAGEAIAVYDAFGQLADTVDYEDDTGGWDVNADGTGRSLVLCDPNSDNNDPANWEAAHVGTTGTGVMINGSEIACTIGAIGGCAPVVSDPIISLDTNMVVVDENVGSVTVTLNILQENANPTSVDVVLLGTSTATNGADFTFTSPTTVTFPANDNTPQTVTIPITDDMDPELAETIMLDLVNLTNNAVIGDHGSQTITINVSDAPAVTTDLVMTEIMYNPPESGTDSLEFIEIYNKGVGSIDLTGYSFSQGIIFDFPSMMLNAGEFVVVAKDSAALANTFGFTGAHTWVGSLTNGGETVVIIDNFGQQVDSVSYNDAAPWDNTPTLITDGNGHSLVLCDVNTDNADGNNWDAIDSSYDSGVDIGIFSVFHSLGSIDGCSPAVTAVEASFTTTDVCNGEQVMFTDNSTGNNLTYSWDFGDAAGTSAMANPTYTYAAAGTYDVVLTVTDGVSTDDTTITVTVFDLPAASYTFTDNGNGNFSFTSPTNPVGTTCTWDFGDGNTSNQCDPSHTYTTGGTYTVCLTTTTADGCDSTSCQTVSTNVSVEENKLDNLRVYPNPAKGNFFVAVDGQYEVEVTNVLGAIVTKTGLVSGTQQIQMNDAVAGVYLVKITAGNSKVVRRLIIE